MDGDIGKYRKWFREAVDGATNWQRAAREDYEFVSGKQWTCDEIRRFEESGRPALTINRIKPLMNLLSDRQRTNRYDIDFPARTPDDGEVCAVRKGITKYILDRCEYASEKPTSPMQNTSAARSGSTKKS